MSSKKLPLDDKQVEKVTGGRHGIRTPLSEAAADIASVAKLKIYSAKAANAVEGECPSDVIAAITPDDLIR